MRSGRKLELENLVISTEYKAKRMVSGLNRLLENLVISTEYKANTLALFLIAMA